ncbi:MAG: hypothetical protein ACP5LE_05295 [Thermoplasmata archaeon]
MIEHEVLVIGNTLSAHITAALLAKKGINVGWVRRNEKKFPELENLWFGPIENLIELGEVLGLHIGTRQVKDFYVVKHYRSFKMPITASQMIAYRYLPLNARPKIFKALFKLSRQKPDELQAITAADLFSKLKFDEDTSKYLGVLGGLATGIPYQGMDAVSYILEIMKMRKQYPDVYSITPGIEEVLQQLREVYSENAGAVYDLDCEKLSMEDAHAVAVITSEKNIEAKSFVVSVEAHKLYPLLNNPHLKEFAERKVYCLDAKIVLKEKNNDLFAPLIFQEYPLIGVFPLGKRFATSGRMLTYWRFVAGRKQPDIGRVKRKIKILLARNYANIWQNVEDEDYLLSEVPLPHYKKIPQLIGRNLFIGTRSVYGNNLRDEVKAGIDAFMLSYKYLTSSY